jgi:demethylmenaquinone methyltransferase / 2-methoxy-6-polyprenyl-1,4-benzoquinol methylase
VTELNLASKARLVQGIFTRIAFRYDLMNRIMSAGQDRAWRRSAVRLAAVPEGGCLLDLGCGTGDMAVEALRQYPGRQVVALDFTLAMLAEGRKRNRAPRNWTAGDALRLPFPGKTFDAVVSGFLVRNVADIQSVLKEMWRVLKPGGRLVILDATRPDHSAFTPLVKVYLHKIIPLLGRAITGQADAYAYLPDSMEHFVRAEELAARIASTGFHEVMYRRLNFGTMAIHWAVK